ncbi:asparagine synthase C-terminal domain-containing protein [Halorarum salinum]|uniref:Asparagine synthetase B n=1 Tax=Halorarum salinum TaxID=2743089 RepID=A0A7D5LC26_9EURY|nr:asparagine synthase-related protein [Halobaculum salinum]QLG62887.1 asparagine synthetase B [Halobaculum salinum]
MSRVDGAPAELVRDALDDGDPFPGTGGFAGRIDGRLVRDVLGRRPVFSEPGDPNTWSFDPTDLADPRPVPAGAVRGSNGDELQWSLPDPDPASHDDAQAAVTDVVGAALDDVVPSNLAVAFSGGVDSALVATGVPDAPLFVAGFDGAHDVSAAREAARLMGRDLRVVELTHGDLERAIPEVAGATGRTNPMDVAIALPLHLVAERARNAGFDRLAVGQGADELFGGYAKVVEPASDRRVEADTVRGARRETVLSLPDQLERDVLAIRAAGVEPVAPLLHDHVVEAALRLPAELIATGDERKVALRRAASGLVPDPVREADKKAVQYGTYVSRELDRLARRAGFKRRMENHVGRYVESLLE